MDFIKTTEEDSYYNHLEKMSINELLVKINTEDQSVSLAVKKAIPQIEKLVELIVSKLKKGGRLFYIGAGTSGRLGILDASECPPTFGVSHDLVIGLIAGGDSAIRNAVEFAEDSLEQGWKDLKSYNISEKDVVIGNEAVFSKIPAEKGKKLTGMEVGLSSRSAKAMSTTSAASSPIPTNTPEQECRPACLLWRTVSTRSS